MRSPTTTTWRPRTWEVLLVLFLLATLTAEVGLAVGTLRQPGGNPGPTSGPTAGAGATASDTPGAGTTANPVGGGDGPPLSQLVGQKLMVAMDGTTPSANLLGRVRRGEIGGVILFGFNITTAAALRSLAVQLQAAAAAGGQPPLLISTDQEGGRVKRLVWGPPTLTAPQMGTLGDAAAAEAQGKTTGHVLRCAGINNNLAPVADVPASTASFMYRDGRTWSFDASLTATLSDAFAAGLEAAGTVPAMKHFPGIGFAAQNTDDAVVSITASQDQLAAGLLPYQAAIGRGIPMIMLSNATYPAYDGANAAGWSHAIGVDLLRNTLGFTGVTITDSLSGTADARNVSATSLARKAARAGTDMILLTGSESGSSGAYTRLLEDAQAGSIPFATLQASYDRIVALKGSLAGPVSDSTPPETVAPRSRLYAPATLGNSAVPVRTSWSATDRCAVSGYALDRRVDGGALSRQALTVAGATAVRQDLVPGETYRYVVAATDGAGNTSDRTRGSSFEPILAQSPGPNVTLGGSWSDGTSDAFSGGTTAFATAAGATATHTFTGTSVGWVAALGPKRGSADVYVDGEYRSTVSLYAASGAASRIVFEAHWATQGTHTIAVVVSGTAGHPRVDVDAFVHLSAP